MIKDIKNQKYKKTNIKIFFLMQWISLVIQLTLPGHLLCTRYCSEQPLTFSSQPSFEVRIVIVHIMQMYENVEELAHSCTAKWRCQDMNLGALTQESSVFFYLIA